jgi:hypothetical protein
MKTGAPSFEYDDLNPEQIDVHWQHPRTEVENPVLLVWPNPVRDKWAAEVDDGVAWVVCHTTLFETDDGEIKKRGRTVNPNEPIPSCVAAALLAYDGEYSPVETVVNPWTEDDEQYEADLHEDQRTLLAGETDE